MITLADHNNQKQRNELQPELESKSVYNSLQARENACEEIMIGFTLVSRWLTKWLEFFNQLQSNVKQN